MTRREEAMVEWERLRGILWNAGLKEEVTRIEVLVLDEDGELWANDNSIEYFLDMLD